MKKKKSVFLQDPTSFGVYDLKINQVERRIVLMGEVHDIIPCHQEDTSKKFLSVAEFIQEYHQSIGQDKVLDIFSESFYIGKKTLGWLPTLHYLVYMTSHLDDAHALHYIRKRLDTCSPKFKFSLYECPENLRVHLCDVRFVKEMDYALKKGCKRECMVDKLFKIGISYIHQEKLPKVSYVMKELVLFVKKFLFDKDSEEYHTGLSEYIIKETKIHKQMEHIPSLKVRRKLTKWSHSLYDKAITHARKKYKSFTKIHASEIQSKGSILYVSDNFLRDFSQNISLPILYVISVYMDMYLTARLLRKFADNTFAENSIVYVGEYHARHYRELMKILGAKKLFEKTSIREGNYVSCVDISKFYYSSLR